MRQRKGNASVLPVLRALAVSIAYFLGAEIGFALTPQLQPVSTLWPPNAVLLGALLLAPKRSWPLLVAAVFPAHLLSELNSGVPLGMVLSWYVSNCAEALIGAMIIRRYVDGPVRLDSVRRVALFVVGGAVLPALLSSFLDAGFVKLNHFGTGGYWEVWSARFWSNVLAILAVVPVMLTWGDHLPIRIRSIPPRRAIEAAWLAVGLGLVCLFVFEAARERVDRDPGTPVRAAAISLLGGGAIWPGGRQLVPARVSADIDVGRHTRAGALRRTLDRRQRLLPPALSHSQLHPVAHPHGDDPRARKRHRGSQEQRATIAARLDRGTNGDVGVGPRARHGNDVTRSIRGRWASITRRHISASSMRSCIPTTGPSSKRRSSARSRKICPTRRSSGSRMATA